MEQKNQPFFSVVIPSYNRAELIKKSIKSVLAQSIDDWELIIADDCSTDHTEDVVRKFDHKAIHFHQNPENKGNAGARNLGAKKARGKYIAYLDSDDQYHSNFLEEMKKLIFENNDPGFLWCNVNRIDKNGKNKPDLSSKSWHPEKAADPYLFFLKGLRFGTDFGFTVRKDSIEKTGYFDENLRAAVDTDFMLRIVQNFGFAHTSQILVDTYDHEGERVRKDTTEKLRSYEIMLSKHRKKIHKHLPLMQKWNYKLMWLCYHNKKKKKAREFLKKAVKAGHKKARFTALLFELLPPSKAVNCHKRISKIKK